MSFFVTKRHRRCHDAKVPKPKDGRRWVSYGPVNQEASLGSRMTVAAARRRAERERRRRERRFRTAPFPLYGLPPSWEGGRFLGGGSWGGVRGRQQTHSLSLVHGVLVEGEGPMLVVETALPDEAGGGGSLRVLAEELWTGRANDVPDAATRLRNRWVGHPHRAEFSPLPSRTGEAVLVEGRPVFFDVLSQLGHVVGRARVGTFDVTIEGSQFALQGVGLVRISDLGPYILGTRRFEGEENV